MTGPSAILREMDLPFNTQWRRWRYKNTTWLIVSLAVFVWLLGYPAVEQFLQSFSALGYLGAFLAGILFVSVFTVAPAAVILFYVAEGAHPWLVAMFAGLGAMLGDYLIFRFLRDRVFEELSPLWHRSRLGDFISRLFRTPYFAWLVPLLGLIVIASPFPDEVGIGLLGASKIKTWQFFLLTFLLNVAGILAVVLIGQA